MATFNDAEILAELVKGYEKQIVEYANKNIDNMLARNVLPIRKISDNVEVDVVRKYDRDGAGAIIASKGTIPSGTRSAVTPVSHEILQLLDGFSIHRKDLILDKLLQNRNLDIALKNISRLEDGLVINGFAPANVLGFLGVGLANPNGRGLATGATGDDFDNAGAWDGSDPTRDIHQDIINAIARLGKFDGAYLVGNKRDMLHLLELDAQRQPFANTVSALFGKPETDRSWWKVNNQCPLGTVFVVASDPEAAELVVQENPTTYALPIQPGQNYPIEVAEWVAAEFHSMEGVVSIDVT